MRYGRLTVFFSVFFPGDQSFQVSGESGRGDVDDRRDVGGADIFAGQLILCVCYPGKTAEPGVSFQVVESPA